MAYRNLDEFFIRLEQAGELIHIKQPVNIDGDITRITLESRYAKDNKALWFDNVIGSDMPVVTNIFTSEKRVAWALGVDNIDELYARMDKLISTELPANFSGLMGRAGEFMGIMRNIAMTQAKSCNACVQDIVITEPSKIDVTQLPILRNHPDDSQHCIISAQLITSDETTSHQQHQLANVQVINANTLQIPIRKLQINAHQERIACAIAVGGDPAEMCATLAPLPSGFSPYQLAGLIRNRPVNMIPAKTQAVNVPSDAEIVIEGWIDTSDRHTNTTLAYETGQYITGEAYATMHITAITHRSDAVYPAFIPTIGELDGFRELINKLFLPVLKLLIEGLIDISLPSLAGENSLAIVSINKHYIGHAQQTLYALWGLGQLAQLKTIIVVDSDVDVKDSRAVTEQILQHTGWAHDLTRVRGIMPINNQATGNNLLGTKLGIDATLKSPKQALIIQEISDKALDKVIDGCWANPINRLIVISQIDTQIDANNIYQQVWEIYPDHTIVLIDDGYTENNLKLIATKALVNIDWETDIIIHSDEGHSNSIGIDARSKTPIKWVNPIA